MFQHALFAHINAQLIIVAIVVGATSTIDCTNGVGDERVGVKMLVAWYSK